MQDAVLFKFESFFPDQEFVAKLRGAVKVIEDLVPYRSRLFIDLKKDDRGIFTCKMRVPYFSGTFAASACASTSWEAFKRSGFEMIEKLTVWKQKRFVANEDRGDLADLSA